MSLDPDSPCQPWNDTALPIPERVAALIAAMTLEEKVAQLYGVWVGASADGDEVAPHQHDMAEPIDLDGLLPYGLGHLTRPFGSAPVDPALGAQSLMRSQRRIAAASRFGIPAIAHEECLAGFATWGATVYPVPLAWGASFDPELVRRMAAAIGRDLRSVGVHQGLAPVLDVVRDARWGRVEETIGEDPHLVATIGTAYVLGLESAGVIATLKHFAGYSASRAGRNLAPVPMGQRERSDVILPPFEMAVRDSGARSVMHAYTDTDGVPAAADEPLLTGLLRDTWGFGGTVVADYFGIAFLRTLHGVAGTWSEAAGVALRAGVDIELPTVQTFGAPLVTAVRSGEVDVALVNRALRRVLAQKAELGLLDAGWDPTPPVLRGAGGMGSVNLDTPANRALAREVAERSVVLLANDGILPLGLPRRVAVIGPNADDPHAMLGCYSFPAHVGVQHPGVPVGIELPTLLEAVRAELPGTEVVSVPGTSVDGGETGAIAGAVELARSADVVIAALGDRSGLFGRGTSGEGCDAADLSLPGAQQQLLDALLAAGPPVITVLLVGRPYSIGAAATGSAAVVMAFLPGEEGGGAVAGVLSGRVSPTGRLPVSVPAHPGGQPSTYLAAPLDQRSTVSNLDPTPAFGFGHGLAYTSFVWAGLRLDHSRIATDGTVRAGLVVTNTGERAGREVVQVYLHDPVATVVRPAQRLIAYAAVPLAAGAAALVDFALPADLTSFTGREGLRVVEPGVIELRFAASSTDTRLTASLELVGPTRVVDHRRALRPGVTVQPV
jgi:beta-xylosidase